MSFVDKPRNTSAEVPERLFLIDATNFLDIGGGYKLIIQPFQAANTWSEVTRNTV